MTSYDSQGFDVAGFHRLHYLIQAGHVPHVETELDTGTDVNVRAKTNGFFALGLAVSSERLDMINLLLARKANVNQSETDGWTALHRACLDNSHVLIVEVLLDHKASLDAKTSDSFGRDPPGSTPMDIAMRRENKDIVAILKAASTPTAPPAPFPQGASPPLDPPPGCASRSE